MGVSQKNMSPRIVAVSTIAVISALTFLADCGTPTSTGTLTGTFRIVTGGVEYRTVPGEGYVIVRQGSRRLADHEVLSGSTFKVILRPGTYQISSTCLQSPHETELSVPKTISVEANVATTATVQCLLDPTTG